MALKVQTNNKIKKVVTQDELATMQNMNSEFQKLKMSLGDIELEKYEILKRINNIREVFAIQEKQMIEKYGEDAIINMKTGDITYKEKEIELIK
jgi:chaperonin cofactor prefoldin